MALSVVQHKPGHSVANATTVAVTITANSAGNLIVVACSNHGTRAVTDRCRHNHRRGRHGGSADVSTTNIRVVVVGTI